MTVTLKDKLPFVVPPGMHRKAGFKFVDRLELKASNGVIMIVPKSEDGDSLPAAFRASQEEARHNGTSKMTMKQINAEIASYRKEKRQKANRQSAK